MNMRCPPNTRLQLYPKYVGMQISCSHKTHGAFQTLNPFDLKLLCEELQEQFQKSIEASDGSFSKG
jgi:hypothetical protein